MRGSTCNEWPIIKYLLKYFGSLMIVLELIDVSLFIVDVRKGGDFLKSY